MLGIEQNGRRPQHHIARADLLSCKDAAPPAWRLPDVH